MKTNKTLFEVQRDPGMSARSIGESLFGMSFVEDDDMFDEGDPEAGRFVEYRFPSGFLKLKQVGAL